MQWCIGNSAIAPCDDDDLDLRTIGKKYKSLGHNAFSFPSSSHMTRFQLILPVQSQNNGSKHLILCISMAYKVIECIVFTQNTKILKISVFAI